MYLSKPKKRGVEYLCLIESTYDKETKKPKKIVIKNFGRYDVFLRDHPEELKELEEKYGNKKEKYKAEKEKIINDFFNISDKAKYIANKKDKLIPLNTSFLFLKKIWDDDLLMPRLFYHLSQLKSHPKIEYNPSLISLYFSVLKIISPSSHKKGIEASPRFLGDPLDNVNQNDVYRCLKYLSDYKESILIHVNNKINDLYPRSKSIVFYDCTNCYFETSSNDEYFYKLKTLRKIRKILKKTTGNNFDNMSNKDLDNIIMFDDNYKSLLEDTISSFGEPFRMYGVSKEKRFDLPIVSIALVIDENAFPIDFKVFPGNKAEQKTMVEAIKSLKTKYNIKHAILVADSALNSTLNLSMLLEEGMGFSVSKSALTLSDKIRNSELNLETFSEISNFSDETNKFLYKIIPFTQKSRCKTDDGKILSKTIKCNLMITFSSKRKDRDIAIINELINKANNAIKNKDKISSRKVGWKQFVKTSSTNDNENKEIAISLDNDLIEKRKKCAGFSSILYKEPPGCDELQPQYVANSYHRLVKIEECFRIMKHEFDIRPMYVRHPDSINGHVLLCVLSLVMIRLIQKKLDENNIHMSIEEICSTLSEQKVSVLNINNDNDFLIFNTEEIDLSDNKSIGQLSINEKFIKTLGFEPLQKLVISPGEMREYFGLRTLSLSKRQTVKVPDGEFQSSGVSTHTD